MPSLTNFNSEDYERRLAAIVERSRKELAELAAEAKEDLDVVVRAAAQVEIAGVSDREVDRMWVQEFVVEHQAMVADKGYLVQLSLPDAVTGNYPHGRHIRLGEFSQREQYLATGRYRAIVQLIRLDDPS